MSSDDEGYVHTPGADPEAAAEAETESDATGSDTDGFGRRGWVLVAIVVLAVLVIPGIIYLYPVTSSGSNIPFLVAMLALPMVPAVLLGLTAVWSMTESSRSK